LVTLTIHFTFLYWTEVVADVNNCRMSFVK